MSLEQYKAKRTFTKTPEPKPLKGNPVKDLRFVIQKHKARRLHYDLRLELKGVLKSWAVPKGMPESSTDKRLAVQTEDHPIAYLHFSGTIPEGNYGAGIVEIWDEGIYFPVDEHEQPITSVQASANLHKGELKFQLVGKKYTGVYVLVQLKDKENWLLIKHKEKDQKRIKPMLATLHEGKPFDGKEWLFEIKWDGYRAIAEKKKKNIQLYSRNGILFSDYPLLNKELGKIIDDFIMDGEIVVLDEQGHPSFQLLQQYKEDPDHPLDFYVFDLLYLNDKDLKEENILERKKILVKLLSTYNGSVIRFSDHIIGRGKDFFEKVKEMGLEGIIAKKIGSRYIENFRSKEWLKIKNVQTEEAIIIGYTHPQGSRSAFGALVLANLKGGKLYYIGHVGTGFTDRSLPDIKRTLDHYKTERSPLPAKIKLNAPVTWLKPVLICTVKFSERTKSGLLRHPVFLGLRPDKELPDMKEETEDTLVKTVDGAEVKLTNLHKMYWPEDKIRKGDMLTYYANISTIILPYLKDRPLSLRRMPNGIHTKGFYHKDAGENAPTFVQTEVVESESSNKKIDYILCNNAATLLYVANLGSIEMNPWNSTRKKPDHPTYIVIDIDPSDKNGFEQVMDVALTVKEVLDNAGIQSFPKTSGATGIHIYIPMGNKYDYEQAKDFAHLIAIMVHHAIPDITSLERIVKKRGDRIYIDYLQNAKGQTLASAYSVRPVHGAKVSAPLLWNELKKGLTPDQFTIFNMIDRVQKIGDHFSGILGKGIDLKKSLKNLRAS